VINWWRSSVTSLSHWPSTAVCNTIGVRQRVARVCQRQTLFYKSSQCYTRCCVQDDAESWKPLSRDVTQTRTTLLMLTITWRRDVYTSWPIPASAVSTAVHFCCCCSALPSAMHRCQLKIFGGRSFQPCCGALHLAFLSLHQSIVKYTSICIAHYAKRL